MRILFFLLLVFLSANTCFAQVNEIDPGCREKCNHAGIFSRASQADFYQYPSMDKYDVKYLKLNLAVEAANPFISGTALTIVKAVQPLDSFVAELRSNMIVDSVFINGTKMSFQRGSDHVFIALSPTLPTGSMVTALFYYRGTVASGAIYTGTIASNGLSYTATLSESYQAREWFPVKQVLKDKIDSADIWITTSATNKAGSNGVLVSEESLPNSKKLYKWKTRYPMNYYLPSFSVGNYFEYLNYAKPAAMSPDSILIQNYVANNTSYFNSIKPSLDKTPAFIEKFSELFGLYPFKKEKYGHAQANIGGGMEHQTMTTLSSFGATLIAHELGHQWWGDNVTCATWNHIWLNEGFASYCEYLAIENLPALFSPTTASGFMQTVHTNVMSVSNGSVYVPEASIFDENRIFSSRLSYNKGSAIIHNLRFEMQDDNKFFQTLKNYQLQYKDSVATADDFKLVAETTSGKNFTDFFNQWYYGEGYPTFNIAYFKQGADTIILSVNETVSASAVTPFFKGLFEFKITSTQGDTTVKLNVSFNNQQFKIYYPKTPNGIVIDPNNWVLNANGTITNGLPGFDFSNPAAASIACSGPITASITLGTTSTLSYNNPITLSASSVPAGASISFSVNPVVPGSSTVVTLNNANTLAAGTYIITITGISGSVTKTRNLSFIIQAGTGPTISTQPANQTVCEGINATFNVVASGIITGYQWQLSTNGGASFSNINLANSSSYVVLSPNISQSNYRYRVIVSSQCGSTTSNAAILTVNAAPSNPEINATPPGTLCLGTIVTLVSTMPVSWSLLTGLYTDIAATTAYTGTLRSFVYANPPSPGSRTYTATASNGFGCTSASSITLSFSSLPTVSFSGLAPTYCTNAAAVTLTGTPSGGTFSGPGITGNSFSPSAAGAGNHTIYYIYTNENSCSNVDSQHVSVSSCPTFTTLNLKTYLEGFYESAGTMRATKFDLGMSTDPTATDDITVNLWSVADLSNLNPNYTSTALLHTNGTATVQFPLAVAGNAYYIAVKHRNCMETWSKTTVSFSSTTSYDFSTGLVKAYDDGVNPPMKPVAAGIYALYTGDVNQDGGIDASDISDIDNDNSIFAFGYNITDVTGDGATDASDLSLVDNNQQLFLFFARPY